MFLPDEGAIIPSDVQEGFRFEKDVYLEGKTCL